MCLHLYSKYSITKTYPASISTNNSSIFQDGCKCCTHETIWAYFDLFSDRDVVHIHLLCPPNDKLKSIIGI